MKNVFIKALLFMPLVSLPVIATAQLIIDMQDAFELASKGNRRLLIERIGVRKANEAINESKSYLLPAVSANAGYNAFGERPVIYLRNEAVDGNKVADVRFGGRYTFDGSVTASYPVVSGSARSEARKARIESRIQEQQVSLTEEDIAWEVGNLYLDILLMQANRTSIEHSLQRNEHSLKDSRSLFLQGKHLKTDTLSNYISVQNLRSALLTIENEIIVKKMYFKHVLGVEDSTQIELADSLAPDMNLNFVTSAAMSIAEDNRKEMKLQKLLIDRTEEELMGLKASFKPQLTALAQYQIQNQSDNLKLSGYNFPRTSFVGLRASVPIYAGKRLRHKTSQLEFLKQQNEIQLAEIKSKIKTELESVSSDLISAYNEHAIRKQNVDAALTNYTMMSDRYRNGLGTRLEVTDAEVALTKARLDLIKSVHLIKVKQLQLQKTTGTLKLNVD